MRRGISKAALALGKLMDIGTKHLPLLVASMASSGMDSLRIRASETREGQGEAIGRRHDGGCGVNYFVMIVE